MSKRMTRVLVCLTCLALAGALAWPAPAQARGGHHHGWVWALPLAAAAVTIAGLTYYNHAGVYYRPAYGGYVVVPPPAPPQTVFADPFAPYPMDVTVAGPPPPMPAPMVVGLPSQGAVVVSSPSLNVRSGPGYNYSVVTVVTQGSTLTVLNASDGWLSVRTPLGDVGWVAQQYTRPSDGIPADG